MATLTLRDDQVLDLVRQLPDERRAWLFQRLIQDEWPAWTELSAYSTDRIRAAATARGLDWERLTESERENLVDTILHEPD